MNCKFFVSLQVGDRMIFVKAASGNLSFKPKETGLNERFPKILSSLPIYCFSSVQEADFLSTGSFFYSFVSQLFFSVGAVVVWGDGEQANEIAFAKCRRSA